MFEAAAVERQSNNIGRRSDAWIGAGRFKKAAKGTQSVTSLEPP